MEPITIVPEAHLSEMLEQVIDGAIRDYFSKDPIKQLFAIEFLTSKDYLIFADAPDFTLVNMVLKNPKQATKRRFKRKMK